MKKAIIRFERENRGLLIFIVLMLVFRSAVADWNDVPTGSMKPTIQEGDRILVNKMAYDVRVPFTNISLYKRTDPQRGDVIIFDSEVADKRLVKRVIGVPGDQVAMINNQLVINGQLVAYQNEAQLTDGEVFLEQLPGSPHAIKLTNVQTPVASFANVMVPEGHYLALGDNRNNSSDSRMIGFVPRYEIVGRSSSVVLSLDYDNYYLPRAERFFKPLD